MERRSQQFGIPTLEMRDLVARRQEAAASVKKQKVDAYESGILVENCCTSHETDSQGVPLPNKTGRKKRGWRQTSATYG